MDAVGIIEARMTSSRLPGKVLLPLAGKPVVLHVADRLAASGVVDEVLVATTTNDADDELARVVAEAGYGVVRGSEADVLGRVADAAVWSARGTVVRVTGDCPLVDPSLIAATFELHVRTRADLTSNAAVRSYPDGMDCAVLSTAVIRRAAAEATDALEREHSTLFIRRRPERFKIENLVASGICFWPELGLTLDTQQDLRLMEELFSGMAHADLLSCESIIEFLRCNPHLVSLNSSVMRKGDS